MVLQRIAGAARREEFSWAIWVPTLWIALSSLRYEVQPGVPNLEYSVGHPFPILFMVLLVMGFAVLLGRMPTATAHLAANPALVFLFLFLAVSLAWAPFPWMSFKRWVKILGALGMVLIVVSEPRPAEAFAAVVRRYFYLIVPISLLLVFFVPALGREVFPDGTITWVGVTPNRNYLGKIALLCGIVFTWDLVRTPLGSRRRDSGILLLTCLFVIIGSGSVTSLVIYAAVAVGFLWERVARRDMAHIGGILAYLAALTVVLYLLVELVVGRGSIAFSTVSVLGRDATLTGRVTLWSDLWGYVLQRPAFGHGYSGFWIWGVMEQVWERHRWYPTGGHNGYLDVVLDTGFVGLAIFLAVIARGAGKVMRQLSRNFEEGRLKLALLIAVLAHNLTESSFMKNDPYWFALLFVLVSIPLPAGKEPLPVESSPDAAAGTGARRAIA